MLQSMRTALFCAALLAQFTAMGQGAPPRGFSIADALSAPFSNQLAAAPAKARVAWVTDAEGRRNVWVAGSTEAARSLTRNTADDGQDIDNLTWSADAEQLAWTRGTGAQGPEHPVANPAELPGPIHQNVEFADLRTGLVRVVAEGHAPLFLPDGQSLLFLRAGNIWIAGLGGERIPDQKHLSGRTAPSSSPSPPNAQSGEEGGGESADNSFARHDSRNTHQLIYARGSQSDLRLSPDGTRLTFVSHRGDHSFIGLYTLATRELRWLDPGTGLDHDPVWSPDGQRIAFIREVPLVSPIAERWLREGAPWSLRLADTSTGKGRELWRASPGPGSLFHGVAGRDQLLWMRDGRLIFPWEKTGWTSLYSLAISDRPPIPTNPGAPSLAAPSQRVSATEPPVPAPLSPGDFEVESMSPKANGIVYAGNRHESDPNGIDRLHLWTVTPDGSNLPIVEAAADTLETGQVTLSDGRQACMQAGPNQPFQPILLGTDPMHRPGNKLAPQLVPETFPSARFITPQPVLFSAADGLRIRGQLFLPPHTKAGDKLPAVVFFHGGSRRQMLLGFHPMQYYAQAYEFNQYLASRGFAVLSVNYRSGTGYGLNFRQALNYGANGASEDNDIVGAARYLANRPDIDAKRIGAWGGSYGGYLTALALARHSDLYAAGVDLHGVHDWSLELDLWKPMDDPATLNSTDPAQSQATIARRAFAASPLADVARWRSPVLLIQGDDDRNVLFSQTVRLAAALRRQGVQVEEKVFPDEVHDFLLHRHWTESYELAARFLQVHLQPAKPD